MIIDEVQYAPKIFRYLKLAIDQERAANGQYLLTGSQKFNLMQGVSDSLAGRIDIFELENLNYHEIQRQRVGQSIDSTIFRGGFPELYTNNEIETKAFYQSYLTTYLERDVRQTINIRNLRDFERFIRACAIRSGQLLNKNELARDVGVSPTTVNQWLSILQSSNQIFLLEPWFSNKTKSIIKTPKLYLADCGLLCELLNIRNEAEMLSSPFWGHIWETFVYSEIRKFLNFTGESRSLYFLQDRGLEIDFLIHRAGTFYLIECKTHEHPRAEHCDNFKAGHKILGTKKVEKNLLICRTSNDFKISTNNDINVNIINLNSLRTELS
ncbi:MAG: DUF4143 domain-containing protein [Proteobacteria bacterium]|nr:DUF4143 domain-containing protein [Pseudomonadota bacterium]